MGASYNSPKMRLGIDDDGDDDEDKGDNFDDGFGCVNCFDVNLRGQVGGGQTQQDGSLFGL